MEDNRAFLPEKPKKKICQLIVIGFFCILLFAALAYGAYYGWTKFAGQGQATPAPSQNIQSFINQDGGYSFQYPNAWKAAVNQYNNSNSLFGPDADSSSGLGGVEVFENQTSVDAFLDGVEAQYLAKSNIAIDKAAGIKAQYRGTAANGMQVVLLWQGKIYNIYLNSQKTQDINLFDQLISSFKFLK